LLDIDRQFGQNIPDREHHVTVEEIGVVVREIASTKGGGCKRGKKVDWDSRSGV